MYKDVPCTYTIVMPSRNTIKVFEAESVYHIYNRGVDKRVIFIDQQDYKVFLSLLKFALSPKSKEKIKEAQEEKELVSIAERCNIRRLELFSEVKLLAFCLMPNHFHLLVHQQNIDGITKLMRSVATGYSMYFNKKYKRRGTLFEGRYKARRIEKEGDWLNISRYIHLNAADIGGDGSYKYYPYSSMKYFLGRADSNWLNRRYVLQSFSSTEEYERFVDEYIDRRDELKELKKILANSLED